MKFISQYEKYEVTGLDSTSIISTINSLKYIIEDEGFKIGIDSKKYHDRYCTLYIYKKYVPDSRYELYEIQEFMKSDHFLEFIDRFNESLKGQFYTKETDSPPQKTS